MNEEPRIRNEIESLRAELEAVKKELERTRGELEKTNKYADHLGISLAACQKERDDSLSTGVASMLKATIRSLSDELAACQKEKGYG